MRIVGRRFLRRWLRTGKKWYKDPRNPPAGEQSVGLGRTADYVPSAGNLATSLSVYLT
jgi:hypothetical protein